MTGGGFSKDKCEWICESGRIFECSGRKVKTCPREITEPNKGTICKGMEEEERSCGKTV